MNALPTIDPPVLMRWRCYLELLDLELEVEALLLNVEVDEDQDPC